MWGPVWPWGPLPPHLVTSPCSYWPLPLWWHWALRDSHLSPSPLRGIITALLDGHFCLQPLMCQVLKPLSIQSIHANLLNGQKLLKNKSTLSPPFEKAMAPHSSTLAWKISWMEEPGRLQSMGSLRVGYDWATSLSLFTFRHWRRKCHPTPVFLPGESQGWGSLVGCHLWGHTELDTTEVT